MVIAIYEIAILAFILIIFLKKVISAITYIRKTGGIANLFFMEAAKGSLNNS